MFDGTALRYALRHWFVGEAQVHGRLKIHPVFPGRARPSGLSYVPLHEALQAETALVREKPEATVPVLVMENRGAQMVLAIDGQELVGGKQDRMVTTSLLVEAGQTVELPVACVEQRRWRHTTGHFSAGHGGHASLRRTSHHAVSAHLRGHGSHHTDQQQIWSHLSHGHAAHGSTSPTGAMRDLHGHLAADLEATLLALPCPKGAIGVVAVLPDGTMAADVFDRPETAASYWPRLLRGYAWDALNASEVRAAAVDAEALLEDAADGLLQPYPAPGCGRDVRISGSRVSGAALCFQDTPVHVSLFAEHLPPLKASHVGLGKLVMVIPHFLSAAECQAYVAESEARGFRLAPITTSSGPLMAPDIRNNQRVMFDDPALAERLWQRLQPHVPAQFEGWHAHGLNERFRFYRYDVGQRFAPHYDGSYQRNPRERSMLTFMLYLNDGFEDGQTRFFDDLQDVRFAVRPQRGMALIFDHDQLHEGASVTRGRKYVLRTDVMYRTP